MAFVIRIDGGIIPAVFHRAPRHPIVVSFLPLEKQRPKILMASIVANRSLIHPLMPSLNNSWAG